ncbi:divergent polysaccharide deacetylase family protein [Paenibacillus sp. GYB004]|uniref:divergent polysaccharide deacetylase family protein n=1 Tax=Paenibacillus sp. GYB004 TaxID=2994393 RepID=UPI002F966672
MRIQRALLSISLLAASLLLPQPAASAEDQAVAAARMAAIVIDDLGNNMAGTEEIVSMPFPITVAVMPFLPSSQKDAEAAHRNGHEVIVHLPMEPLKGNKSWLGPGAITCDLSDDEIRKRVHAAINDIPHAIGINNHMGSKATVDERVMRVVLEVCRERGLFFLDSHTNYRSVVSKLAKQIGVPCIENHLFLDDVKSKMHVLNQIKLLQKHLREHEPCIAIGHVGSGGKITAELVRQLPGTMEDIQFVGVSKLVR